MKNLRQRWFNVGFSSNLRISGWFFFATKHVNVFFQNCALFRRLQHLNLRIVRFENEEEKRAVSTQTCCEVKTFTLCFGINHSYEVIQNGSRCIMLK